MNRYVVLALFAVCLLSSCHDDQKADTATLALSNGVIANKVGELQTKVQELEERIEKLENFEKSRDH